MSDLGSAAQGDAHAVPADSNVTAESPATEGSGRAGVARLLATRRRRSVALAAAVCAVVGLGVGVASFRTSTPAPVGSTGISAGGGASGVGRPSGGAANARSGPA